MSKIKKEKSMNKVKSSKNKRKKSSAGEKHGVLTIIAGIFLGLFFTFTTPSELTVAIFVLLLVHFTFSLIPSSVAVRVNFSPTL